jgi:hypothetical protein
MDNKQLCQICISFINPNHLCTLFVFSYRRLFYELLNCAYVQFTLESSRYIELGSN